jgi:hypothetical protein
MIAPTISRAMRGCALASALFVLCAMPSMHAQTAALGGVAGTVRDTTDAIVPGVSVVITDMQTGAKHTVTTDSEGHYSANFLQPGNYEVVLGGGSFGKVDRKNVPVTVGAATSLDVTLPLASVTTAVDVTSEAPLVDTEKVEGSQVVDQQIVSNVPVNSRRFESFVLLTPNVIPDGNTGLIGFRGISGVYNSNIVDGANNNQQFFSEARGRSIGAPYVFPVDAIREFESSATGYSAELGGAAGGIINAITKSGGNTLHGDAFEYYRTPGFNALDPYNKFQGKSATTPVLAQTFLSQPVKVQHQFGISLGGPIIKDKLFFHFAYDGYRKTNPIVYTSTFNSATNQVANLVHLCDGGTTNVVDGSTTYPTTIPNVSPSQCAAAVAVIQGQLGAFGRNVKQDIFFPRLDYQLNAKTHLSVEYLWQDFHQPNGYNTSVTVSNGGVSQNGTADFHERFLIANAETALTASSANVVHFQFARDLETDSTNTGGPANSLTNLAALGETSALPRGKFPDEHRTQFTDIYSTSFGHHNLKAGFDLNFVHEQIANLFGGDGSFSYSNSNAEYNFTNFVEDALGVNPTTTTGGALAVRHYNSFSQTVDQLTGVGADDFWNQNLDFFVEDQWKATPKLLISAGLRYDAQLVPGPDMPNSANPVAFNATSQINPDLHMIQPRLGFAYNPHQGTVVRGGYGFFYGQISNSSYYTERRENGVYQKQYGPISAATANTPYAAAKAAISGSGTTGTTCTPVAPATVCFNNNGNYLSYSPVGGVPIYTPPGPAPTNPVTGAPITSTGLSLVPAGTITIRGLDPSFTNPLSQSFDIAVEQELPYRTSLSVGYVGNRATHLPVYIDTNVDPNSVTNTHTYQYTNPFTGVTSAQSQPIYTSRLYTTTGTVATGYSVLDSWYHSLVVTLHKPMSHGVELLANYTFAKALDNGQTYGGNGTFNGTDAPLIPFRLSGRNGINDEYGRSDLDIRGRLVATVIGKSQFTIPNKAAAYAINGWQLSGTLTAQDGEPITATISGSITYLTGGKLGGNNLTTDAGVSNAAFTSGPSARVPDFIAKRNAFTGPGVHNVDARLSRDFPLFKEKYHFELAAEAFNVANHRNILSVNTALVSYTAPGGTTPTGVACAASASPDSISATGNVGCLAPLSASTAAFGSPASTSNVIYGARQLQLLGRFIF